MADESSEAKRYSYLRHPPTNKKPVKKGEGRSERPTRERRPVGNVSKVKREAQKKPQHDWDLNSTRETTREERIRRDRFRGYNLQSDDLERGKRMEGAPRRRPPGGPAPMIQPQVGPVGQLRSQAAHTYGYTPEAYKELRNTPISLRPPDLLENQLAGSYSHGGLPEKPNIFINSQISADQRVPTLAHEQAHAVYDQLGNDNPFVEPGYQESFANWREQGQQPNASAMAGNVATTADADLQWQRENLGLYNDPYSDPTEEYARTVEFSPNTDRSNWPDEVRPYYSGFLQGMEKTQSGEPTPWPDIYMPRRWR